MQEAGPFQSDHNQHKHHQQAPEARGDERFPPLVQTAAESRPPPPLLREHARRSDSDQRRRTCCWKKSLVAMKRTPVQATADAACTTRPAAPGSDAVRKPPARAEGRCWGRRRRGALLQGRASEGRVLRSPRRAGTTVSRLARPQAAAALMVGELKRACFRFVLGRGFHTCDA